MHKKKNYDSKKKKKKSMDFGYNKNVSKLRVCELFFLKRDH